MDDVSSVANRLAAESIELLHWFAGKCKATSKMVGGHDALVSELSVAYMNGIYRWISRKDKYKESKLSTFIVRSLFWDRSRIYFRNAFLSNRFGVREPLPVIFFHGREGRCEDSSLLVDHDVGRQMDLSMAVSVFERMLGKWLDPRLASVVWMQLDGVSLSVAGKRLGVTKERIRQLQRKAWNRILSCPEIDLLARIHRG